ncbi:Hypothetical predicted protein [Pelobates cultripes]|uniref:Uncharacterized protein n=1 Tax=Pelobates cultripes TaxID=61616 RepID=A0AAD1R8P6_PELCU|nr:Hypothetical predicted protein [Pelobates cultripes]
MGAADGPTQLGQQRQATSVAERKSGCQGQHWESHADREAHRGLGSLHGAQSQGSALCTEESGVRHGREGRRGSSQGRQDCRSHPRPEDSRERCRDSVRHDRAWSTRERSPSASRCSRRRSVCRERRRRDRRSASWSSDRSSQGQRCNTYGQEGQAARWDRLREDELERREEGRVAERYTYDPETGSDWKETASLGYSGAVCGRRTESDFAAGGSGGLVTWWVTHTFTVHRRGQNGTQLGFLLETMELKWFGFRGFSWQSISGEIFRRILGGPART